MRALLMGGQACVLYGAAEFSRDTDLAILASSANLARLRTALDDLGAHVIAVPPFEARYLRRGHAVHFRCEHEEAEGMRVDVMTRMRGVAPFARLWARRSTFALPDGTRCDVMSVSDLVQAKKTQRDKDWPMIRRLVEAHWFEYRERATAAQVRFWLRELRTPELLVEAAGRWPAARAAQKRFRPLLASVRPGNETRVAEALAREEWIERRRDSVYWRPLKAELERLRHGRGATRGPRP
ncbi:MAG TPA: hypothetical protein VGB87_18655 [Vicinamibacteria bacterium]